jgi:hypothetical protein
MSRLAAEKTKSITAICLIAVMAFMWVRVLGGKAPQGAVAASAQDAAHYASESDSDLRISFTELPMVEGRNDVLTRDFFTVDDWQNFLTGRKNLISIEETDAVSKDNAEEAVRRIAEKLKLEAIGLGENPQAFINDKLLSVGDKLSVRDGGNTYECIVTGIEENKVSVKFGEAEFTLKLIQAVELTD